MDTELKIYTGLLIVCMVYYFWYTRNSYWKKYNRKSSSGTNKSNKTSHPSSYDPDCDCDE